MFLPVLGAVLLLQAAPPVSSQPANPATAQPKELPPQIAEKYKHTQEVMHQAAIRLNDLATNIHSEQDARSFTDAVAEALWGKRFFGWTSRGIRHRVAHAEFESVSDAAQAIPEQRIADVWNEYIREIDAPEESLVTVAEIHNMRDGMYVADRRLWAKNFQTIWTVPSIHALDADGKLADGCRAIEALKIIHSLYFEPESLPFARAGAAGIPAFRARRLGACEGAGKVRRSFDGSLTFEPGLDCRPPLPRKSRRSGLRPHADAIVRRIISEGIGTCAGRALWLSREIFLATFAGLLCGPCGYRL